MSSAAGNSLAPDEAQPSEQASFASGGSFASDLLDAPPDFHATFSTVPRIHRMATPDIVHERGRSLSRSSNGDRRTPSLVDVARKLIDRMRSQRNFLPPTQEFPVVPDMRPPTASPPPGVEAPPARPRSAQEMSASYQIAWDDEQFLLSDELRGIRLQLEYQKIDSTLIAHGIESTIVVFGSARIRPLQALLKQIAEIEGRVTIGDPKAPAQLAEVKKLIPLCKYYDEARKFAQIVGQHSDGRRLVVMTGGGPGIMEAANRGAHDAGNDSIGLNITLPHEQHPNPYITPDLCFAFHYFSIRKMHFLLRCKALVACPGGFGTFVGHTPLVRIYETAKSSLSRTSFLKPSLSFKLAKWRAFPSSSSAKTGGPRPSTSLSSPSRALFPRTTSIFSKWSTPPPKHGRMLRSFGRRAIRGPFGGGRDRMESSLCSARATKTGM